jgi:apolipoprotein N-acyltransferase
MGLRQHLNRTGDRPTAIDRQMRLVLLAGWLVISGFLITAAESSTNLSILAWVSLLPIFITIRYASPRVALIYGALWGFCLYLFSSATDQTAITTTIRSLGLLTAVPAIYAFLGARLTRRVGYAPLILAVGWIAVELALQPLALRQGLLAGTQADAGLMRIIGGLFGYVFIAFLIAFVNAQLLSLVENLRFCINLSYALPISYQPCGWISQVLALGNAVTFAQSTRPRAPPR